ncbi:MAG TPA: hypothetical protein VFW96_03050 [Thermomicrobiales bacterium]|nr:hypothetical protein [Thermomicrobiales bacterium]
MHEPLTPNAQRLTPRMDPDRVAYFEAAGWRAYYERAWARLLRLTVGLCQEQFGIPFPISLRAAYYVVRASAAWAPVEHDDRAAHRYLERFYRLARRYAGLDFDPARVGALELQYFDVHRRQSGQPDKTEFVRTLTELHGALFGLSADEARESAEWRVLAANRVDLITSGTSLDVEGDWARLEEDLRCCYRSITDALVARRDGGMTNDE